MVDLNVLQDIDSSEINCHKTEFPEDCNSILSSISMPNIKFLSLNIRSLQRNFNSFLVVLSRLKIEFDVIILTECWIHDNSVICQIDGYTSFRTNTFINQSGGVVAYVKNTLSATVTEPDIIEANCLSISIKNQFSIFGIYRSPSFNDPSHFLNSLEVVIKGVKYSPCKIVTGDININIANENPDSSTIDYLCLAAELGLVSAINKPTRKDACLDHILVSEKNQVISVVCSCDITDHSMVMATVALNLPKKTFPKFITKINYPAVIADLGAVDWSNVTSEINLNKAIDNFTVVFEQTIQKHTRKTRFKRTKHNIAPWMTPGLIRCSIHRDRLHADANKNPNNETAQKTYRRYRNFYIELLHRIKSQFEQKELLDNNTSPKQLWKSIRKITHTQDKPSPSTELTKIKSSISESLDHCNEFFANVGQTLANNILNKLHVTQECLATKTQTAKSPVNSFFLNPTDESEIDEIISNLKVNTAPGSDSVKCGLIKTVKNAILTPLAHLCNLSMSVGIFPDRWKEATVVPIYKSGDKDNPGNYRPISLLSCFSKILEKLVNRRLIKFLENNNLLSDRQFGFRRGKSTENAVTLLSDIVTDHLDNGRACVGVFLDLAKAFDTVSPKILLSKLEKNGIRGLALKWFHSYLENRRQRIKIDDQLSNHSFVNFGVPQGSILGPTLFILYLNDIGNLNIANADIICYADDTAIIFQNQSWATVFKTVETGMSTISKWLNNNLLTLNATKTKYLCFHKTNASKPDPTNDSVTVHSCFPLSGVIPTDCNCDSITRAKHIKYLGITIDEKFTFLNHIQVTATRVRKLIYPMKLLRNAANRTLLRTVYLSICQPVMTYCISVWGGAAITKMIILERAQRSLLKTIYGKSKRFPTKDLYTECKLLSLRKLYISKIILSTHKEVLNSPIYQNLLKARNFKIPVPRVKTSFANKLGKFIHPFIYNRISKSLNIKENSVREVRIKLDDWLQSVSYSDIENILKLVD